jgi:hypothetical protein
VFVREVPLMKSSCFRRRASTIVSFALVITFCVAPLRAQQQPASPPPAQQSAATKAEPTFDTLLSADSYKMYFEVRNVGTLLTTGGAGDIVDPIVKLADPGPQLKSLVKFLRDNAEPLAASRMMIATWPVRSDIPSTMVALEFASAYEAAKFAPKLETFLPTVLPPVPVAEPTPESSPQAEEKTEAPPAKSAETKTKPAPPAVAKPSASPTPREMRSPFVLTRSGSLVFISDRAFKIEKLHPRDTALLSEDKNFRVARDRFAAESLFLFFNVALEDRNAPKPSPTPVVSDEEREVIEQKEAELQRLAEEANASQQKPVEGVAMDVTPQGPKLTAVLTVNASPTPTPTKEQQAQTVASNQIGSMLSMLGQGQPQWPEAIGVALALDNDEYAVRAILIEKENAKTLPLPFLPQLISGPAVSSEAASILPDDTEVFVTASIDFGSTYREMKKQAEANLKQSRQRYVMAENAMDAFAEFEKKAGFKITDELLPVLGNELAIAVSLKQANMANVMGVPTPPAKTSSDPKDKNKPEPMPIVVIGVRDRDAARRLMPRVFEGLGIGEANFLAQTERRGDSEIVSYAGIFSYAFVGNFLVLSDSETVRKVADANMNRTTLGANNAFRSARHWQPRQTLGEIYVSPALMEGYQEQIGKQAASMDQAMRDFLMKLSPKASAITYTLSHDGLGSLHELHLPKNLILAMVAGTSATMSAMKEGSPEMNEMIAISVLHMIANGEENYKKTAGNGSYGSIEELIEHKMLAKDVLDKYGYRFAITTSAQGFEAVGTPLEYGKSGKRSFFIDQSGVVRGDDKGGGPATVADKPVDQ